MNTDPGGKIWYFLVVAALKVLTEKKSNNIYMHESHVADQTEMFIEEEIGK